jgi:uncharacterized membrane protein YgcG
VAPTLPEDFDWRVYLTLNPDLRAEGIVFKSAAVEHYLSNGIMEGRKYAKDFPEMKYFNWRAYLELNSDVPAKIRTEAGAQYHYKNIGRASNRPYLPIKPEPYSLADTISKMEQYHLSLNSKRVGLNARNLIIYQVEDIQHSENSLDIVLNNIKVFVSAISQKRKSSSGSHAFYLFNVAGREHNPLSDFIPATRPNVGIIKWDLESSAMYTHLRTLKILPESVFSNVSAVFFTGTGSRGPLVFRHDGSWVSEFRKFLDVKDVGMVSATVSCAPTPHAQTHFFLLRSVLVPVVLAEYERYQTLTPWRSVFDHFNTEMSGAVVKAGYQLASKLTHARLQQQYFTQNCSAVRDIEFSIPYSPSWAYHSWCDLEAQEAIFVRWGGEPLGASVGDYLCSKPIDMNERSLINMEDTMVEIARSVPQMTFTLPEGPHGGMLFDLFKQYREETWRERSLTVSPLRGGSSRGRGGGGGGGGVARKKSGGRAAGGRGRGGGGGAVDTDDEEADGGEEEEEEGNVCLLVRTSIRDDPLHASKSKSDSSGMDLATLIQCAVLHCVVVLFC